MCGSDGREHEYVSFVDVIRRASVAAEYSPVVCERPLKFLEQILSSELSICLI